VTGGMPVAQTIAQRHLIVVSRAFRDEVLAGDITLSVRL
jgi:hypothetical protein